MMNTKRQITLEIHAKRLAYAVYVNGVMITSARFHEMPYKQLGINQWVWAGENEIAINLSVNPSWNDELDESTFSISCLQHDGEKDNYTTKLFNKLEWSYTNGTIFPVHLIMPILLDVPFGNWQWKDADVLTEETINTESLKQFINKLHSILDRSSYEELEPYLQTKSSELAQAYFLPLDQRFADQDAFFKDLFSNEGWRMTDLTFDNMMCYFHAGGRLVEVTRSNGKSLLESADLGDHMTFSLRLFLCHKNNQWILCR